MQFHKTLEGIKCLTLIKHAIQRPQVEMILGRHTHTQSNKEGQTDTDRQRDRETYSSMPSSMSLSPPSLLDYDVG